MYHFPERWLTIVPFTHLLKYQPPNVYNQWLNLVQRYKSNFYKEGKVTPLINEYIQEVQPMKT